MSSSFIGGRRTCVLVFTGIAVCGCGHVSTPTEGPDAAVRMLFQANEQRSLRELEPLVSKDADMVTYSIGARKFVGWPQLAGEMQHEFDATTKVQIPIKDLRVWERGDIAWYTVEIDYIRDEGDGQRQQRTILPLRESGVLERRNGRWVLLHIHESLGGPVQTVGLRESHHPQDSTAPSRTKDQIDFSGEWDIQEADKSYTAQLNASGNGTYTWQGGRIMTTGVVDHSWEGTWHQAGNDREGGFDVRLSDDGMTAEGAWWYTRVGARMNIPPRQWGGSYRLKRVPSGAASSGTHRSPPQP
jgi:hypothetical protein